MNLGADSVIPTHCAGLQWDMSHSSHAKARQNFATLAQNPELASNYVRVMGSPIPSQHNYHIIWMRMSGWSCHSHLRRVPHNNLNEPIT